MKKIIAFILCAVLFCTMPIVAHAEGETAVAGATGESVVTTNPTAVETATEGENSADTGFTTEDIVAYIKSHIEEISVIGTLLLTIFYEVRKHGKLNGSIGTLNNNAITVAENSAAAIKSALAEVEGIAEVVKNYKNEIKELLDEIRKNADEKESLETTLAHVEKLLSTSKLATLELSNEVAELLVLANIPNAKKEELYSRHRAAVDAIAIAESEVKSDEGTEA